MTTDIISTTRDNMLEKLVWAERSFNRMTESMDEDPVSAQDYFWSFLHATHLLWFYFKDFVNQTDLERSAKSLIQDWKGKQLSPEEVSAWDDIFDLRDVDVHVKPVFTEKGGGKIRCGPSGFPMCSATGQILAKKHYMVLQGKKEIKLLPLCENGLAGFKKFVEEFDTIPQMEALGQ